MRSTVMFDSADISKAFRYKQPKTALPWPSLFMDSLRNSYIWHFCQYY